MAYVKKVWKDYPDTTTPIVASDMNNIEDGIEALDTGKVNIADINNTLTSTSTTVPLSANQGKVLNDRLALIEYEKDWYINKASSGSTWWKILRIEASGRVCVRLKAFSQASATSGRGHFEVLLSTGKNNERADVIVKTNGLTTGSFDYRIVSTGVYEFWYNIPQFTYHNVRAKVESWNEGTLTLTTYNEAGTPSGTVVTVA